MNYWIHRPCLHVTPLHAEIKAPLNGLTLAKIHSLIPLQIYSDSMELVHAIDHDHILFTNILSKSRHLMQELEAAKMKHIYREQNQVADKLAKEGRNHPH